MILVPPGQDGEGADVIFIDFGRSMELNRLDYQLEGEANIDDVMCRAMRNGGRWGVDSDLHGLCTCAFTLLFGKDSKDMVEVNADGKSSLNRSHTIRRYWKNDLWNKLFDKLLNFDPNKDDCDSVVDLRDEFNAYVAQEESLIEGELKEHRDNLFKKRGKQG